MTISHEDADMTQHPSQDTLGLLDRPIFGRSRLSWWMLLYALVLLFIIFTRLWNLSPRGYSHDESIHAWEAWKLVTGQRYVHSPTYHGPFLYHFTALIFALFGHNDYTGRLSPALFGIALTILPLLLIKWLGRRGVLLATLLMAVSPVMMHRSRFLRHDPYVAVFNLMLFIALLRYLDRRQSKDLYWAAALVALGFAAKETTFITYFIFGTFLLYYYLFDVVKYIERPWGEGALLDTLFTLILGPFLFLYLVFQRLTGRQRPETDTAAFDLLIVLGTLILPMAAPFVIRALGRDPMDYSAQGLLFSGAIFMLIFGLLAVVGILWDWRRWLICAGIAAGIFVPLFTTMFTNGNGLGTGTVGQLGYWLAQQEVKRGGQPWYYYLVLMPLYEFLPILLVIAGILYYLLRGEGAPAKAPEQEAEKGRIPLIPLLIYWIIWAWVMYSWAGEKMPWLMMHLALPMHLFAGWVLARLLDTDWRAIRQQGGPWLLLLLPLFLYTLGRLLVLRPSTNTTQEALQSTMAWLAAVVIALGLVVGMSALLRNLRTRDAWRLFALSVILILLALTVRFAWMVTFINADLATEFLVYAQGSPDVALVARELETMSRRLTGGLHMKVAYDDDSSWPFVWYLRNFDNAQFYGKKPAGPFDAEAVIVGPPNEAGIKPLLGNRYYRRQYRLIWWPNQDWYMNMSLKKLWADLRDPVARKELWNVIFYRKHAASLTAWPYVHNFALYLRRDIVQQLWDYGPEALTVAAPLPGDEYVEKWEQRQALATWGYRGNAPGQFNGPRGVTTDAEGNIYVADTYNHRVQVFGPDGAFLRQWGSEGVLPGQFKEPWGIGVAPNGDVYVADTWNHRIQVFDREGKLLRAWGQFGEVASPYDSPALFYGPRDVAFAPDGSFYVSDTGNKRVIKYDANGQMVAVAGGLGDAEGQMQEPVGIAYSPEGVLYVADTWNQRIQAFDADLYFLRSWPVYAWEGMSVVNKPYLAVDAEGHVYATDPESYRIIEFDSEGKVIAVWGQYGSDLSSMNLPTGIAIDPQGRVIVTDAENHRLLIFG